MNVTCRVFEESYLIEIERDLEFITGTRHKIEEIILGSSIMPQIKSEVMRLLALPRNLNLSYALMPHHSLPEIVAIPVRVDYSHTKIALC